jgi:hypothetical protein
LLFISLVFIFRTFASPGACVVRKEHNTPNHTSVPLLLSCGPRCCDALTRAKGELRPVLFRSGQQAKLHLFLELLLHLLKELLPLARRAQAKGAPQKHGLLQDSTARAIAKNQVLPFYFV